MNRDTAKRPRTSADATIQTIARDLLGIETLETRHSDRLDFHDLAVWQIRQALAAAFEAGQQTNR
ncbi:MAG: hypothetical protein IT442_08475 [Phycisphaeraceae bacterium]|nr:hypothetical protein [Phycisphaeraceae bacterium]